MNITVHASIDAIDSAQWNALIPDAPPFLRHEFLSALERHHAVGANSGWHPAYLVAAADGRVSGALPMYRKDHSFGEFVFDWTWASACERYGMPYYPKLVVATPYSPVSGDRILIAPESPDRDGIADALIDAALAYARELGLSSLHWLFMTDSDSRRLQEHGFMPRTGCQFHWDNPGYRDFDDFLAALSSRSRKEVRRERRAVAAQEITVEVLGGDEATPPVWDAMHRFYRTTFAHKSNHAPLSRGFFHEIGATMGRRVLLILARHEGRLVAGALFFTGRDALYGRHWGADRGFPNLHFELCYYRAIEVCIERGLKRFEAGAQGEYKIRRGFRPTPTRSAHWIADPRFAAVVAEFLDGERRAVASYIDDMRSHLPYRTPP